MTTGVRELRLWQEAVALGADVTRLMRQSSRRETKVLTEQCTQSALGVATSVADGYVRTEAAEQRDCYRRGRRCLSELETLLAVARQAELVSPAALAQVMTRLASVSRLLSGYLSFLERQIAAQSSADTLGAGTRGGVNGERAPQPHQPVAASEP